jgi:type III secretion protein T
VDFLSFAQQFVEHFYAYVIAISFASARMTGLIVIMPAFTRMGLTRLQQTAAALALALPLVPMIVAGIAREQLTPMVIAFLLFKEVLIGLVIGVVLGVPIWAAETAGDILDLQRGSTAANLFDPSSTTEESITGTLFGLIMVALYFGSGGLALTLHTVYDSYAIWPASSILPALTAAAAEFFVRLLDSIVTMGLVLVGPIVIFMLLTDLTIALVSRAAPALNVFALSLGVKNFVFTLLLVLYGAFLIAYMRNDLGSLLRAGSDLETLATPGAR